MLLRSLPKAPVVLHLQQPQHRHLRTETNFGLKSVSSEERRHQGATGDPDNCRGESRNYFAREHQGKPGNTREGQSLSERARPHSGNKWAAVNIVVHINHGRRPDAVFWGKGEKWTLGRDRLELCFGSRASGARDEVLRVCLSRRCSNSASWGGST